MAVVAKVLSSRRVGGPVASNCKMSKSKGTYSDSLHLLMQIKLFRAVVSFI